MAGNGRREAGTRELFWREHVAGWEKSGQAVRGWPCGTGGVVMLDFLPFGCVRLNLVAVLCTVAPFVAVGCGGSRETGPVTLVFWHAWTRQRRTGRHSTIDTAGEAFGE